MQVTVNTKAYEVPFDLASISLGDFINYQDQYGSDIDKLLIALSEKEYTGADDEIELQKAMDLDSHLDTEALAWYSYWTKTDLYEVRHQPNIEPVLAQYRLLRFLLKQQMEEAEAVYPLEVSWNDEQWEIQSHVVNPESQMSYNEIVTSKETMRQLYTLGKSQWHCLLYLCCIYFRKKDEAFDDTMIYEGGERMELLKGLPLNIAVKVSFFLNNCVNILKSLLASSVEKEVLELRTD